MLEDGLYLLGPMSEPDLRSAIEGPARRAGLRLEPGLVDLLVREVEGEPAALPLLSHVLRETWERREGPTLTVTGYRATGGIRHAVAQSAESLYDAMDAAQRGQLRGLLLRLVMPTEDGDPVRARVPRAKVAADDAHRIGSSSSWSTPGWSASTATPSRSPTRRWCGSGRGCAAGSTTTSTASGSSGTWPAPPTPGTRMGRPDSELYRGARLSRTLEWRDRATPDLNDTETAFLDASVALSETELHAAEARVARERTVNRRLRGALAGVAVAARARRWSARRSLRRADAPTRRASGPRAAPSARPTLAEARRAGAQAP